MANSISIQSNANSNNKMGKGTEKERFIKEAKSKYLPRIALEAAPTTHTYFCLM